MRFYFHDPLTRNELGLTCPSLDDLFSKRRACLAAAEENFQKENITSRGNPLRPKAPEAIWSSERCIYEFNHASKGEKKTAHKSAAWELLQDI